MGSMASQITSLTIVYSTVDSGANQRKHQSSASLVFVWGIHRWPVNFPHKWPVTQKMFPFNDVIMRPAKRTNLQEAVEWCMFSIIEMSQLCLVDFINTDGSSNRLYWQNNFGNTFLEISSVSIRIIHVTEVKFSYRKIQDHVYGKNRLQGYLEKTKPYLGRENKVNKK